MSLPALANKPRVIVFTDWDGTVTLQDSNDYLTDNLGHGYERRRQLNMDIMHGRARFRDAFSEMLESIHTPFDVCVDILKDKIQLDPGFLDFYRWASANNVPIVVVSSGMEPIIRALLAKLVGETAANNIEIVSNNVHVDPQTKKWHIVYRDETDFGHDKSRAIRPYAQLPAAERPVLFYCGDGVSDVSAAKEADLLFAKRGRDLVDYCEREDVKYTLFDSFHDILDKVRRVAQGTDTVHSLTSST